jgi:hypothetical protein
MKTSFPYSVQETWKRYICIQQTALRKNVSAVEQQASGDLAVSLKHSQEEIEEHATDQLGEPRTNNLT